MIPAWPAPHGHSFTENPVGYTAVVDRFLTSSRRTSACGANAERATETSLVAAGGRLGRAGRPGFAQPCQHAEGGGSVGEPWVPPLKETGGVLLSQGLAPQVPSARAGLTSLFGMGRGISPSL